MAVQFQHTIREPIGLHARPAGMVVKKAKSLPCTVTIACHGASCNARKLLQLMELEARSGDTIDVTVEGPDENTAAEDLRNYLAEVL